MCYSVCQRITVYNITDCTLVLIIFFFFFSSRRRHTRFKCDWSSDVCSSDLWSCITCLKLRRRERTVRRLTIQDGIRRAGRVNNVTSVFGRCLGLLELCALLVVPLLVSAQTPQATPPPPAPPRSVEFPKPV